MEVLTTDCNVIEAIRCVSGREGLCFSQVTLDIRDISFGINRNVFVAWAVAKLSSTITFLVIFDSDRYLVKCNNFRLEQISQVYCIKTFREYTHAN